MQIYKAPIDDMIFQLGVFGYARVQELEAFAAYDSDTTDALLRQTAAFCEEVVLPTNRSGDKEGLKWDPATGDVTTPKGFREVYARMVESGFVGVHGPTEYGGGGAPIAISTFTSELSTATNKSLSMCPGLTAGLTEAIMGYGSDALKAAYLPKLVTGEWSGTMCLTEPQCGTDLGMVATRAVPEGDHYKLTGTKIWITFGEHDLTENIIHLVLARLPDAPAGIKGISTFVVPKITLDGRRNGIRCAGLEHKMGIHASPTCVMDLDGAEGWLVGEPHRGMQAMFVMMNGARLLVGMEGIALSEIAYQTALTYARDRRQSRALDPAKREPGAPADNILVHPDVRRMLLNVRSSVEGMRGLATWVAVQLDLAHHHPDAAARQDADDLAALLTPVVKGYCTERGFLNVSEAMQVCGGAGYTVDWSIEQYLRDVRIAMIYEGTNHIQALDLVGRKLPRHGGRAFGVFVRELSRAIEATRGEPRLRALADAVAAARDDLVNVTSDMGGKAMADPEVAGAAASNYLNLFGLTAVAYSWLCQARQALAHPSPRTETKLKLADYFMKMLLPERLALAELCRAGKEPMMCFSADEL
jgi:alkylation response protein AidB-like acyl-CoA dehydrogenase